jgi:enterochelin esterase-like enzyme
MMKQLSNARRVSMALLLAAGGAWAQQAQVNLEFNPQKDTEHLIPYMGSVNSPEVRDDHTVTFRLKAPKASEVLLSSGTLQTVLGLSKAPAFEKDASGLWTLTLGPVPPNMYVYQFKIDGVQVADPSNTVASIADQPPYSQLVVHGSGPAYYDAKPVPHGAVTRNIYHSTVTNGEREIFVYTPPGYKPGKKYPVLYLFGGSGELAYSWLLDGRANFIMDNLLAEGKAVPMVIAMGNNQVIHRSAQNHTERSYQVFEQELRKEIVPFVEKNYSVRRDPKGRALAGLSMGGRHAQFVGWKCLDLFANFGLLSSGDPETEKLSAAFLNDPNANKKVDYLFVGQGTHEETPGSRTLALRDALVKHGIKHEYYAGGGGAHDWTTWRHLLNFKLLPGLWRAK